jgi:hypothetical protein
MGKDEFFFSLGGKKRGERASEQASFWGMPAPNNGLRELETRRLRYTNFDQQKNASSV